MKKMIILAIAAMMAFAAAPAASAMSEMSSSSSAWGKKETKTVVFSANIHCNNCKKKVMENLSFEKGVIALEVSVEKRTVTVTYDPAKTDEAKLAAALKKLGFPAEVVKE